MKFLKNCLYFTTFFFNNIIKAIFTKFMLMEMKPINNMKTIIPSVTKLSSRVVRLLGCNPGPMTLQGTNTYIIGTGFRRILLDTGESRINDYINNLKNFLATENVCLEHIIISHWHADHIGGLDDVLENINSPCQVWKHKRTDKFENFYENGKIQELVNKQEFKIDGAKLKVIYTPGHTTDHVVLHMEEENAIFTGDCILGQGSSVFDNLTDYMNSLAVIKKMAPTVIYPGHGPERRGKDALRHIQLYIDNRIMRENEILQLLRNANRDIGLTAADIVEKLYEGTPKTLLFAALHNVKNHLNKLHHDRKVEKDEDRWLLSKL